MFCFCSHSKLRYWNVCAFVSLSLIYFFNLYFSNTVPVTKTLWYTYVQENSPLHTTTNTLCYVVYPGGYKEMSSIFAEGGDCGVSAYEWSSAHHVICSPNKLWRPSSIFNLNVVERKCAVQFGKSIFCFDKWLWCKGCIVYVHWLSSINYWNRIFNLWVYIPFLIEDN